MTKGTILFVGPVNRESELLEQRLRREGYQSQWHKTPHTLYSWLKKHHPQAILITGQTPQPKVEQVLRCARALRHTRHVPILCVAADEAPGFLLKIKGIGETLKLHSISLAEALRRLRLAIELSQLAR